MVSGIPFQSGRSIIPSPFPNPTLSTQPPRILRTKEERNWERRARERAGLLETKRRSRSPWPADSPVREFVAELCREGCETPWRTRAPEQRRTAVSLDSLGTLLRRDPRTDGWPLLSNKEFIVGLLCAYVYFVKFAGPRFMQGRKPYENLKPVIVVYNAAMVILNLYFTVAYLSRSYLGGGYSFVCQGIDFDARDEMTMSFLAHCWWYLWVRIADFLDTIFFVLRKKDSHISVLHVVHHVLVVFNGWFGLAYGADGHIALTLIFNSFVHVVMYTYYFLSLLGPSVRKHLWWKRYLTQLQMFQFVVLIAHGLTPLFVDCGYPMAHLYIGIPQGFFFLVMFLNFYLKNYNDRKKAAAAKISAKSKLQ